MKWVMIVDDSEVIREVTCALVQELNLMPVAAQTPAEALDTCRRELPAAVIVDDDIAGECGIQLIADIRNLGNPDHPVIFFSTTDNDADNFARAAQAGAGAVLLKPFDLGTLRAGLERFNLVDHVLPSAEQLLERSAAPLAFG